MTEIKILEGKSIALAVQEEIKASMQGFVEKGLEKPCLHALQTAHDASSEWYLREQEKLAAKLGIEILRISLTSPYREKDLISKIEASNRSGAHGIFVTMPLPQGMDADEVLFALDPHKDVEGIHPANLGLIVLRRAKLIPPTAMAALRLIESTGVMLRGKKAAVIGQSAIVGRPVQLLLGERRVTTIVCNTGTPPSDIEKAVRDSMIVVACAGQPGLIKGAWIRKGALVIDIGTTEIDGKLVGDVEFDEARKHAAAITPVPGGVGPLTVTMLMLNLIHAYKWQKGI